METGKQLLYNMHSNYYGDLLDQIMMGFHYMITIGIAFDCATNTYLCVL